MARGGDAAHAERTVALAWVWWCGLYGAGIIICLVLYGLLQERIMSEPYGDDQEVFGVSVFLVFCNRAVAVAFAGAMIYAQGESTKNAAPLWKYLAISFSNVAASWCQYEALKYVSFPVQMLGKSFKMMPVMLWGIFISGKRYDLQDWLVAFCVTGGVTEFLLTGEIAAKHPHGTSSFGLTLLAIFLALDGFTSTFQEKLFREHLTSKYNQMFYVNSFSSVVSFTMLLAQRKAGEAFGFCWRNPAMVRDSFGLSAAAVAGQFCIYSQVKEFGALVFAATMNVRQVVSILISYATYHHQITILQILGLLLIFLALLYKSAKGLLNGGGMEKGAPVPARFEDSISHAKPPLDAERGAAPAGPSYGATAAPRSQAAAIVS